MLLQLKTLPVNSRLYVSIRGYACLLVSLWLFNSNLDISIWHLPLPFEIWYAFGSFVLFQFDCLYFHLRFHTSIWDLTFQFVPYWFFNLKLDIPIWDSTCPFEICFFNGLLCPMCCYGSKLRISVRNSTRPFETDHFNWFTRALWIRNFTFQFQPWGVLRVLPVHWVPLCCFNLKLYITIRDLTFPLCIVLTHNVMNINLNNFAEYMSLSELLWRQTLN